MSPVVMMTRIQPAVSRFTISHPTKLRAAISQTTATSRKLKAFTGRGAPLQPLRQQCLCRKRQPLPDGISPGSCWPGSGADLQQPTALCEPSFTKAENRFLDLVSAGQ